MSSGFSRSTTLFAIENDARRVVDFNRILRDGFLQRNGRCAEFRMPGQKLLICMNQIEGAVVRFRYCLIEFGLFLLFLDLTLQQNLIVWAASMLHRRSEPPTSCPRVSFSVADRIRQRAGAVACDVQKLLVFCVRIRSSRGRN